MQTTTEPTERRLPTNWALAAVGVVLLFFTVPAAAVLWFVLPEGRYPVLLIGLPALPLLWIGLACLRSAGVPVEDYVRQHPRKFGLIVGVGSVVLMLIMFMIAGGFGWID